ncbi:MAG: SDR family NAD(P)-dependent oxidoreductase [Aeromicrobium sp.]|uniref:SDR family NAD(P)-dependent oxidoreductase n=1 Tax=Aeromicrobium sp. TaxID=1871063 RepID=UPI0025B96BE9|nr:SDR family oxidoreductase [Aeromicrobium sp.]MCK5891054.1 SDR family oxidoreductase [Aeromicrobium sp.]MDF1703599.1 SDR family NAD(P)-dependent oxidoreductase [Aeromicrobium sp.]
MADSRRTANRYALDDKVVLVTGAGSGIGRAIARGFLDNGARVVVTGRRLEPLEATVVGYGPEHTWAVSADVSDAGAVARLIDGVVDRFGRLDVVVSNAAAYRGGELEDLDAGDWHTVFSTNVDGLFHLAQAALPQLEESGGNLVAISSVSGAAGDWGQAAYNASKHAINGLVRSLALDYGDRGVRLNLVAPAFTLTEMTAAMADDEENLAPFVNRIALGRPGEPEDVVGPVLFLASDDARYMTGSIVTVDGGTSASTGQPHV